MAQAKGVLPTRGDDREVLYRNPAMCGYFIRVRLVAGLPAEQLRGWLAEVSCAVDVLVAREAGSDARGKGQKVASVAVGFAPRLFERLNAAGWFPGIQVLDVDALFYVAAVQETRVNEFVSAVAGSTLVEAVSLERGYQTSDETEPFGYKDGEAPRVLRRSYTGCGSLLRAA